MNTRNILIGVVACIVIGSIAYLATGGSQRADTMNDSMKGEEAMMKADAMQGSGGAMMPGESMSPTDDTMMPKSDSSMMPGDEMMVKDVGTIEAYGPEKLALAQKGKVVLFFHADWCPICRQFDAEAKANPTIVPDGVHILKVDFDTAIALRQKYGVTVQHTFVQVDAAGATLGKWSDATAYAQVFARLK